MIVEPPLVRVTAGALLLAALLALPGCEAETSSSNGGGGSITSTPPSEGGGGAGGATPTTSTTTTTPPLTCSQPVTKPEITPGECDLLQQNCPPGETCVPTPDGKSTVCRKEGGLKGAGKPCELGTEECQAGLFCIGPTGGVGFCTRPCCKDDAQPCGGGNCNAEVTFQGGLVIYMCTYSVQCALFQPDTCENGQKCQFVYPNQGLAVCTIPAPEDVPEGGACTFVNQCGSNQVCHGGVCRYSCKPSNSSGEPGTGGCPPNQACQDVYTDAAGDVGVCQ